MRILFQVMDNGPFKDRVLQTEAIEGTKDFCDGYKKALGDFFPCNVIVGTIVESVNKKI